jgi:hypothetical protein
MAAIVGATLATTFIMAFVAAAFPALLAAPFATAVAPDRVAHHVERLDRSNRIVALDDQLASDGTFFHRFVADNDAETGPRVQYCRKWIVD